MTFDASLRISVHSSGLKLKFRDKTTEIPYSGFAGKCLSRIGISQFEVLVDRGLRAALNLTANPVLGPDITMDKTLTPQLVRELDNMPLLISVLPGQKMQVLFLRMATDLSNMKILAVKKQGGIPLGKDDIVLMAEIKKPTLLFPTAEIAALPSEQRDMIFNLYRYGNYIIEMDGVFVEWNASQDKNVWGPSIDTVLILNTLKNHGLFGGKTRKAAEIGTGNGMLAKAVVAFAPHLEQIEITDIELNALACAERNIKMILRDGIYLASVHAPGMRKIDSNVDLIVSNPPYIPKPKAQESNPYEGTGLIREIITEGPSHLNSDNPEASIVINISSLALRDFEKYVSERDGLRVEKLESLSVPLKINWTQINPDWVDFLIKECGMEVRDPSIHGYKFWHTLNIFRIRPNCQFGK